MSFCCGIGAGEGYVEGNQDCTAFEVCVVVVVRAGYYVDGSWRHGWVGLKEVTGEVR